MNLEMQMKYSNLYWMQSLPTALFLSIIGPIILPEWFAFGLVLLMGVVGLIGSSIAFVIEGLTSSLPLGGAPEAIGILVGFLVTTLGAYLLFGPAPTQFIFDVLGFLVKKPHHMIIIGAMIATAIVLIRFSGRCP